MIDIGEFEQVDAARAADLIRYLEAANALPGVQRCKQIALAGLGLRPGQAVLDVGCGYGADVAEMAVLVGSLGRAVGIDASGAMIAAARQRFASAGLPATFETADVCGLRFADATFDACRAERLLQHVADPGRAVCEMARVTRPGGRVAAIEFDVGGLMIDSADTATTRAVTTEIAESTVNGWAGRQLPRLFTDAGLRQVHVTAEIVQPGHAFLERIYRPALARLGERDDRPAERLGAWSAQLQADTAAGRFFAAAPVFIVSAIR